MILHHGHTQLDGTRLCVATARCVHCGAYLTGEGSEAHDTAEASARAARARHRQDGCPGVGAPDRLEVAIPWRGAC